VIQWADDLSYLLGKHSLKTGVDIQQIKDNTASGNFQRGGYTFASLTTFLAATPTNLQAGAPLGALPQWRLRQNIYAVYGQDDYTLNPRLTLNLGLRWEAATDPKDADNQAAVLPSASSPAFVVADRYFKTSKDNIEPRLGAAWKVTESGKTVVRAAAGLYHNQILPWLYSLNIFTPPYYGRFSLANPPFPNGYELLKPGAPLAVAMFPSVQQTPSSRQYNVSVQQQMFGNTVLQIAYAGNRAEHLQTAREVNTPAPTFINGDLTDPLYPPAGTPRQNPAFAGILALEMNGRSNYDSLTITLRRQSSNGFQGQVFYTYSKAMDLNSSVSGSDSLRSPQAIMNPYNIEADWARADFDVTHNLVGTFSLPLPSPATSKALGAVVNGWTLDGIATLQSGMPFTARLSASASRDLASTLSERPDLKPGFSENPTSGVSQGCPGFPAGTPVGTPTNWFDPCAFSLPQAGTYGDLGRNTIIGPGLANLDLALGKTFKVQRTEMTFKAEMFNVTNRANFGLPSANALTAAGQANPSAGLITYTTTSARQLQFALRVNF
jgi:hypothetical protein